MTKFQFIIAMFCAEWLIIFKAWVAPSVLFMLVALAGLRLYLMSFIPHWMGAEAVIGVAGMALFIHLRHMGRNASFRDFYKTPAVGVPWLILGTKTQKSAMFLEIVIAMCVVWFYFPKTPFRHPYWENAETIGATVALVSVFGLTLWNAVLNRKPREVQQQYKAVHAHSHKVRLPSVKQMMEELGDS